ncbi:hypothetical protein KKG31_04780 [Patescibacteria group bacterium]|nr:hypothetical protein [Patescibacteria group bacterium]MBU1758443.1 hypothetical protein [Patescibacteria group bacterium]
MMLNKPSNYIEKIGRQTLYTIMLLSVLQLNTSFSDIRHSQDKLKDVVEVPLDLKEIYKANISKSVLEAKSFPIHFNYAHEKELKE